MKLVRYIFIGVVALTASFLSIGLIHPTGSYEITTMVNKPAEVVYANLMDESVCYQWMSNLESLEIIEGDSGQVGAKFKLIFNEDGEKMELIETVTEIIPNKLFAFSYTNEFINGAMRIELTENAGKTEMVSKSNYEGNGIIAKSMLYFFKSHMIEHSTSDYNKFKEIVEGN